MARNETAVKIINVGYSAGSINIPLPTTNTVFTDSVYIGDCLNREIGAGAILNGILSSANTIVTLEQAYGLPVVEGSADALYVAVQTINITAVGTWNYVALLSSNVNAVTPYIRFKVTSVTTNTSSTVNIKLCKQVSG